MRESYYDVLGPALVNLQEPSVIDYAADYLVHVISLVGIVWDYLIQGVIDTSCWIAGLDKRSLFTIVGWQEAEQRLDDSDALLFILSREMRYAALGAVYARSAELLLCDSLACDSLDYARSCQEHIRCVLYHYCEVSQSRGVYRPSGARTEDSRDLGDHAGSKDVPFEYLTESGQ